MANIIVTVVDDSDQPVQNAAVTVINGNNPQVLMTDPTGQATFQNLAAATYRIFAAHQGFISGSATGTLTAANDLAVRIEMTASNEDTKFATLRRLFFTILTGVQYVFLAALAAAFAYPMYKVFTTTSLDLRSTENARGMITFVVAFGTIAIGLILVMSAAFLSGSKDLDRRFAFGKDVFTVLIGVLGTVMGFYYGQNASAQQTQQALQISPPQVSSTAPQLNTEVTLTATISGGTTPYKYTINFDPKNAIAGEPIVAKDSADGKINQKFMIGADAALADKPVGYTIEATDAKGAKGISDKGTLTPKNK